MSSQSEPKKRSLTIKRTHTFFKQMCLSCLINIKSCYFDYRINKHVPRVLAAWSAFRALFTWSWHTTCAKDHRLFLFLSLNNYPQINKVRNFPITVAWTVTSSTVCRTSVGRQSFSRLLLVFSTILISIIFGNNHFQNVVAIHWHKPPHQTGKC